jgi:hypothetical protein
MPLTETHLKKRVYKALEPFNNCYRRKVSDRFHAGVLDLFICFQGRAVWLELKILPNKLTPLQKNEIQEYLYLGLRNRPTGINIRINQEQERHL